MTAPARTLAFSPSDLSAYLACPHLAALSLEVKLGKLVEPTRDYASGDLIRRKGEQHEALYLESLRDAGRSVVEIDFRSDFDWHRAAADTERAIRDGADVVYQAVFVDGDWRGFADFVERQEDGSYEVVDTKLARHAKPSHIFQLCFYSSALGRIQGREPQRMHLVLGDGRRETLLVSEYDAYYRRIRDEFRAGAEAGFPGTKPIPCAHCALCAWQEACEKQWDDEDSLFLVAGITRKQVERIEAAGVTTLAALSGRVEPVDKVAEEQLAKLREQAELQHYSRTNDGKLAHRLLATDEKHGFGLLPPPDDADVYFDIEGDPFYSSDGSLEYLFGVTYREDGERRFRAFWARNELEEKTAFEELVAWIVARRTLHPGLHVYHYANYERAALQRLMQKHGACEDEVDDLLRKHVLVDLYQVVRQALRLSLPSYSLKKV
ncbi:MAG TPA: TM0106 family RecB-like putative nuclease, partial [Gaiellaceae bacterium]|nr:TM0106 family RecB-like putative nuclease [Gaiellaceae bacterium]